MKGKPKIISILLKKGVVEIIMSLATREYTFNELLERQCASRTTLAARLRDMREHGILEIQSVKVKRARYDYQILKKYRLTKKGKEIEKWFDDLEKLGV